MAAGGPPWNCGYDDHSLPPVRGWGNQGYHTASHFAVMSILTALLHREATGEGQFIGRLHDCRIERNHRGSDLLLAGKPEHGATPNGRHAAVQPTGEAQVLCADGRYANTGVPPRFPHEFANLLAWLRELQLDTEFPEAVFIEMGANWDGPLDLSLIGTDDTVTAIFSSARQALQLVASRTSAYDFFIGCQNTGLVAGMVNSRRRLLKTSISRPVGSTCPCTMKISTSP